MIKKLIPILALLCFTLSAQAAVSLGVHGKATTFTSNTDAVTLSGSVTAGSTVWIGTCTHSTGIMSISAGSDSFTAVGSAQTSNTGYTPFTYCIMEYVTSSGGGYSTVTITYNTSTAANVAYVIEVKGGAALDGTQVITKIASPADGSYAMGPIPSSGNTSGADFVITYGEMSSGDYPIFTSGATGLDQVGDGADAYTIQSSAGSVTAHGSNGPSDGVLAMQCAFSPASAGSAVRHRATVINR